MNFIEKLSTRFQWVWNILYWTNNALNNFFSYIQTTNLRKLIFINFPGKDSLERKKEGNSVNKKEIQRPSSASSYKIKQKKKKKKRKDSKKNRILRIIENKEGEGKKVRGDKVKGYSECTRRELFAISGHAPARDFLSSAHKGVRHSEREHPVRVCSMNTVTTTSPLPPRDHHSLREPVASISSLYRWTGGQSTHKSVPFRSHFGRIYIVIVIGRLFTNPRTRQILNFKFDPF